MKPFKFFQDNEDEIIEPYDGASWTYVRLENLDQYEYDIHIEHHYGIRSFLNNFPSWFVISILSITGPNGIIHNIDNNDSGWGFDILNDLIEIEWVRFIN